MITQRLRLIRLTGIVAGETLTVGIATGNFNSKDVLAAHTVNITSITLADGADLASNYNLTSNTATDATSISPRTLTITADAGQAKVFGNADPVLTYTLGGLGLVSGDTLSGVLTRNPGEVVAGYAINQGTMAADSNYTVSYVGNQFNIHVPATVSPRTEAGLVDVNPAFGNYTQQSVLVLNVEAPAAGNELNAPNHDSSQCAPANEPTANDKDVALMLNFGLNLPKGINTSCI